VVLDFGARPNTSSSASPLSLPISPPTAALAPWPSRNFTESAKPKSAPLKPLHLGHRQARPLEVPQRDPRRGARSLGLAPKDNALRPALQLSRARSRRNPRAPHRLPRTHPPRPIQFHPARVPRLSSKKLSNSWPATATSKKAWASWP
jgi:hypothetical protein